MNAIHDIHIIEKTMSFTKVSDTDDMWETGDWHLFPAEITKIDGGNVYLHLNQKAGCHFGGQILEVKKASWGTDRVVIRFRRDQSLAGTTCSEKWGQDNAIAPQISKAA